MTDAEKQTKNPTAIDSSFGNQPVIDSILRRLAKSSLRDKITVFGSVARGTQGPRDLDIWVDMKDAKLSFSPDPDVQLLLVLARAFPGYFDPFVQYENATIVRNADCSDWVGAKFAKKIRTQMEKEGIPLAAALIQRKIHSAPGAAESPKP